MISVSKAEMTWWKGMAKECFSPHNSQEEGWEREKDRETQREKQEQEEEEEEEGKLLPPLPPGDLPGHSPSDTHLPIRPHLLKAHSVVNSSMDQYMDEYSTSMIKLPPKSPTSEHLRLRDLDLNYKHGNYNTSQRRKARQRRWREGR